MSLVCRAYLRSWRACNPAAVCVARALHSSPQARSAPDKSYQFVVCGAGSGGLAVGATLARKFGRGSLAVIEPSESHYYQPAWTLVGAGEKTVEETCRPMAKVMPREADWLKTAVSGFRPDENTVVTADGQTIGYHYLIVALGLQVNFKKIKGLLEALEMPDSMVASNYSAKYTSKTFENMKRFQGGNAIFNMPTMPIKCPGAPQKIMYLADDFWRQSGVRDQTTIRYNSALQVIFAVKKYANGLLKVVERKGIEVNFKHNLIEVKPSEREAVFQIVGEDRAVTFPYDFLHAVPPMGPLDFMKGQPIADEAGWVDVHKETLRHKKYGNIFALGDCANVPTSKTAAACAAESGVLKRNLFAVMKGDTPRAKYDGYTSCPLITGYGKTILAEFDFNAQPLETFPFDQGQERMTMYYLKKDVMPEIYWHGLVRGMWGGPGKMRKIMHLGMSS